MKKTKLIGLVTLLMSLGVSGCFGTNDTNKDVDPNKVEYVATAKGHTKLVGGEKVGSEEPHVLVDSEGDKNHVPVEATCEKVGKAYKKCSICGRYVEEVIPALGHDLQDNGGTTATCDTAGAVNLKCTRCDYTESKASDKPLGHQWGTVEAVNEKVGKATCGRTGCSGAIEYVVDVSTANLELASGSSWKTNPSTGAFKLNGDGQSCSFTFNLPKGFTGQIYQRGYMDAYKNNYEKKVFFQTNSHSNIDVTVNGTAVDMSKQANVIFSDVLGNSDEDIAKDNSDVKDVLIGDVTLSTTNTITYKRVETLNMIVSAFVFVGKDA